MNILGSWVQANQDFNECLYDGVEPLSFGNVYLDKATRGIFNDDFILIGAPTGVGKTQFCMNIAMTNIQKGKKVHFIALEASENEIQKRIAYNLYAKMFYDDLSRCDLKIPLNFPDFILGKFIKPLEPYKKFVDAEINKFKNLFIHYGGHHFTVDDMIKRIMGIEDETDLIIIDHVHYFEFGDRENENVALKKIAKTARRLSQQIKKPIILVAHLRKKDRASKELVPGIEEFHGTSDLAKIATKVITLATGEMVTAGRIENYLRVVKNRFDGSVKPYLALMTYNFKMGCYDEKYYIGKLAKSGAKFEEIENADDIPFWAR